MLDKGKIFLYAAGIFICHFFYGIFQEKMYVFWLIIIDGDMVLFGESLNNTI